MHCLTCAGGHLQLQPGRTLCEQIGEQCDPRTPFPPANPVGVVGTWCVNVLANCATSQRTVGCEAHHLVPPPQDPNLEAVRKFTPPPLGQLTQQAPRVWKRFRDTSALWPHLEVLEKMQEPPGVVHDELLQPLPVTELPRLDVLRRPNPEHEADGRRDDLVVLGGGALIKIRLDVCEGVHGAGGTLSTVSLRLFADGHMVWLWARAVLNHRILAVFQLKTCRKGRPTLRLAAHDQL